jgi:hypothetical protein
MADSPQDPQADDDAPGAPGLLDEPPPIEAEPLLLTVLLAAGVLRLLAVVGQHAYVYADSIDYEQLDFTGRARRPWVTPLLYHLVSDPALRLALQASIGAACWSFLALQVAQLTEDRRIRWALLLTVLALSLTTTVTSWDTAMLSESLALSFTALLLGALAAYARRPNLAWAGAVLAAWILWIWTRQAHLVASVLATIALGVVLAALLARRRRVPAHLLLLVPGVALITLVAGYTYSQNTEIVHFNLAMVIGNRVLPDPGRVDWYLDHGMPRSDLVTAGHAVSPQDLLADPGFSHWVDTDALQTYARDLLEHPWRTATEPLDSMVSDRPPFGQLDRPDDVMLASPDSYGVGREVLPRIVEELTFDPGQAGMVVLLLALVVLATAHEWSGRGFDRRWRLPLLVLALQLPTLLLIWHSSTAELGRLALPSALILRIALFAQLALLVDGRWSGRDDRPPVTVEPTAAPVDDGR